MSANLQQIQITAFLLLSQRAPLAVFFPPSASKGTHRPLACPVSGYICVIAATSPASLWDKRRATAQWKLAFATCVNNPSEYPGFDLPSECSEATINSKVPHQVKMSLGVSSPRKLWLSPCLNWKRLSICVRHYTVSYLVFFTVLLNGKYKWLIPLLVISATQMVSSCSRLPPECVLLGCLVQYVYMRLCLHPYSMSFCIGSVIEKNPQFCDFFN